MATNQLNTQNPNQLEYQNQMLRIAVLGGIRLDGLDRMRVTVKIQSTEVDTLAVRHNLDLYNDTQVEKLIRKTASKLEIGTSVIEASINELIEALEKYRLEELENTTQKIEIKQLTEKEKTEALELLQAENLLPTTNNLIGKSGIIGEETNRLIMYLIFSSRKREQPLHIISLGSSGTGKTHLQESIGNLIPNEEKVEITTLSENAFYYFGQQELKHKLILIEDLDGAESALYPIRELQSKKRISKTVAFKNTKGETKSQNITVEGPVCVSGCTTKETIYEDNANRSFLIYLDESPEQDQKIMNYQRKASAGKIDIEEQLKAKAVLQNSQYLLKPIKVVNPYAEVLELPNEVLKPRRTNAHYLQFIELITYYHQYQRALKYDESTGEEYIETTIEDIKNANELLKEILLRKSDVINGATRNYLENLKSYLIDKKKKEFTNSEIRRNLKVKETTLRRYHKDLEEESLIAKIINKESRSFVYRLVDVKEYEILKSQITNILENCLDKAQTTTIPPNHQKQSGEHNKQENKELNQTTTKTTKIDKRTKKETNEL